MLEVVRREKGMEWVRDLPGVFQGEGLVGEGGVVVDACAACAVGVQEVAALDHEALDLEDGVSSVDDKQRWGSGNVPEEGDRGRSALG